MKKLSQYTIVLIALLLLQSCASVWHVSDVDTKNVSINAKRAEADPNIDEIISPYKSLLDEKMNEVLVDNMEIMYKEKPNSALGNWMADAVVRQGKETYKGDIDFGILNHGGIRIPNLPAGPITVGKVYELMPFDNTLVILHTKGDIVQLLAERIVDYGGWPISQELRIEQSSDKAINVFINDAPLDMDKEYHYAIADYVANGGDKCTFLKDQKRDEPGVLLRDIFIKDLRMLAANNQKLEANNQIRIK